MYALPSSIRIATALLGAVCILSMFSFVDADTGTSTHFMTGATLLDSFGGGSTSTSYSSNAVGQQIGGESTSTSFLVDVGAMYFDPVAPAVGHWHWYSDVSDETPTVGMAPEDVSPSSVVNLATIKLRVGLHETAGIGADGVKFALQYSTSSDFSSSVNMVQEIGSCVASSTWCYASGAGADNAIITTAVLTGSGPCVASVGNGCGTHNTSGVSTSSFTQLASVTTEYEFTLQESGASADTVYFFRPINLVTGLAVPVDATSTSPSLSTEGATLTFTIGGIATSTPAGGVTTNITTTSNNVPFGSLSLNTPVTGAQSLVVSTNAAQGYEIYAYEQQGLQGDTGGQFTPVSGTNATPVGWSAGCVATSTSCYGYHTDESVLAGGSTRFAADDTYAQFASRPQEVAYSSGPTYNRTTHIVYKVVAKDLQAAGNYTGGVVYIVVPTF